jgi:hypothetical protein
VAKAEQQRPGIDFSSAVLEVFRKRSRAISRRGATVQCVPVKEIVDGIKSQRGRTDVSIAYRIEGARVELRVHAWGDRWVWIDARRHSKSGWVWEFTNEGRFVSPNGARDLVACVEDTLDASFLASSKVSQAMSLIWSKRLSTGPRRV